jgi:hypothetical protein
MSDPSSPPRPVYRRRRPAKLSSQRLAPPVVELSMLPAGSASCAASADPAETDRRQLAAQVQAQIIAPLRLLLAQAAAFDQTLADQPATRMAVSVLAGLARQAYLIQSKKIAR